MALSSNGTQFLSNISNRTPYTPLHRPSPRTLRFTVSANPKKLSSNSNSLSSRTGKFDSKNRKTIPVATEDSEEEEEEEEEWAAAEATTVDESLMVSNDGVPMPKLPAEEQDFWEGPQWDGVGFFVQYMWAFGVVFAVRFPFSWLSPVLLCSCLLCYCGLSS